VGSKRYFTVLISAVEMFSVYVWKTNLNKSFVIFNLFYLHFCFGLLICIGSCNFRRCRVLLWHGSLRNITLLHTIPHQISATLHLKLFTPQAIHTPYFVTSLLPTRTYQPLLCAIAVYWLVPSFPLCLS